MISNLSLTDSTKSILYIWVDNVIRISGKQFNPTKHSVEIIGGGAKFSGLNGNYIVRVEKETNDCQILIKENSRIVSKKSFIVRQVGDLVVKFGGVKDTSATVNQHLANPFLYLTLPDSYYKHNFSIVSFLATFIYNNGDSLRTQAVGNLLTTEQKEIIKKLVPPNKIVFETYVISPDSRRRKLPPFTITIK